MQKTEIVFHGTSKALAELLRHRALLCGLLKAGQEEKWRKQIEAYRTGTKRKWKQRLLEMIGAGYEYHETSGETATHVFVTPKLETAKDMAGWQRRNPDALVLEFRLLPTAFEPHPLYFSKSHARAEKMVPGKIGFEHLVAVHCHPGKVGECRKLLDSSGFGHVAVRPLE